MKILGLIVLYLALSQQALAERVCSINALGVFTNRIHIHCLSEVQTNPSHPIVFFATPVNSQYRDFNQHVMTVVKIAMESKKKVRISFSQDSTSENWGCQSNNCARLDSIEIFK